MNLSIIIPSRKIENLRACLIAVRSNEPHLRIIVIDDGLQWGKGCAEWLAGLEPIDIYRGTDPFIFSRAINQGIKAAGSDDVILLNDDALLKERGGFMKMQAEWKVNRQYGLIGSSIDKCGTPYQHRQLKSGLREVSPMLVFACVFIPRRTINMVGLLDEGFGLNAAGPVRSYGLEDDDYSWRVGRMGLKLAVSDSCFVTHTELPSTFGFREGTGKADIRPHQKLFRQKWGEDAHAWCR